MAARKTYLDRILTKLKNHKIVSLLIILGMAMSALAQFTDSLKSIVGAFYEPKESEVIWDIELPAYVITESAFATREQAGTRLAELNNLALTDPYFKQHFNKTGFFWIPDFPYLTGKELYQVYIGPFKEKEAAQAALCDYNEKYNKSSYGLLLTSKPGRDSFFCAD